MEAACRHSGPRRSGAEPDPPRPADPGAAHPRPPRRGAADPATVLRRAAVPAGGRADPHRAGQGVPDPGVLHPVAVDGADPGRGRPRGRQPARLPPRRPGPRAGGGVPAPDRGRPGPGDRPRVLGAAGGRPGAGRHPAGQRGPDQAGGGPARRRDRGPGRLPDPQRTPGRRTLPAPQHLHLGLQEGAGQAGPLLGDGRQPRGLRRLAGVRPGPPLGPGRPGDPDRCRARRRDPRPAASDRRLSFLWGQRSKITCARRPTAGIPGGEDMPSWCSHPTGPR